MMRLLRPTAALSLLRSRTGLAILASRATHASHPHGGIFWRSFRLHSAHYARETIAKICSPWVIALRSPRSAQARGDHPWSPVRRMRRTLATAIISQTGSWRSLNWRR
jgi:hypothetical protein